MLEVISWPQRLLMKCTTSFFFFFKENRENEKEGQEPLSVVDELSNHKESNDFSRIKQEFAFFQKTGKRTENLNLLCEA
jgi:hypothetical protein